MPTVMEARVARARKIPYEERDLAQAVADFYLLETLGYIKDDPLARWKLDRFEKELAKEFANYLDIAIGGELRYAKSWLGDDCPKSLRAYTKEASMADRGTAWVVWGVVRRAWGLRALELAEHTFELPGWRGAFGGDAWASIVSVLRAYLEKRINERIFVDRCFSLEHNGGCVFNKLYDTRTVKAVLEAHGDDDYSTLRAHASKEIERLWRRHSLLVRLEYDPTWYGAPEYPDTTEDIERWEKEYGWKTTTRTELTGSFGAR
jgi:hypothetical protein